MRLFSVPLLWNSGFFSGQQPSFQPDCSHHNQPTTERGHRTEKKTQATGNYLSTMAKLINTALGLKNYDDCIPQEGVASKLYSTKPSAEGMFHTLHKWCVPPSTLVQLDHMFSAIVDTIHTVKVVKSLGYNKISRSTRDTPIGHCAMPQHYSANPRLGQWVSKQRSHYKLYQEGKPSSMTAERIREFESMGFKWNSNDGANN